MVACRRNTRPGTTAPSSTTGSSQMAPMHTTSGVRASGENGAHATGALLCAAGFAALISLAGNQARLVPVTRLLEQAGEIWLSLYTGQLLIGLALFSLLPGLSLYGRLGPAGLALTGFLLCVVQALAVWAWSRSFRTGPVEWLLDRLSRRQFGPLRRGPGA